MVTVAEQVAALLAQASPTTVPSGVLLWFGDTDLPDGTGPDPPVLAPATWAATYSRLAGGAVGSPLPQLLAIQARGAQPGAPVPLAIAAVAFHRPTAAAVRAVTAAARNGSSADLPDDLGEVVVPAETTIVTALLADQFLRAVPAHRGGSIELTLPPDLLVSNMGGPISDVEVDAGDGFRPLEAGGSLSVEAPPGVAELTLTVRCTTPAGPRVGACALAISDDPVPPAPDETWELRPPGGNTGRAHVFRAGTGERLDRPVLIAEGWPGGHSPQMLAEMLGQHELMSRLLANGHDVIAVGFDRGIDSIQSNAPVVAEAARVATERTDDALVVGGMSMGGLVARYALLQMEQAGADGRVAVYLSLDTPHGRGAYTTVVGQWFVNHFTALSPVYGVLKQLIVTPSNLQFVMLIEQDGEVGPHELRTQLLTELDSMGGYPARPVKLAVSCGRGGGATGPAPTAPVLRWSNPGLADVTLLPMPATGSATVATGATLGVPGAAVPPLVVTSDACWESVPGALNVLNESVTSVIASLGCEVATTLGVSSSVPTVSALDASVRPDEPIPPPGSGASPFDDYFSPATDQFHLQLTAEHVDWLVDRIERHQPATSRLSKGPT